MPSLPKLDCDKFAKVHALAVNGTTKGERDAALASAERMAKASGLTLVQAIAIVEAEPMLKLLSRVMADPVEIDEEARAAGKAAAVAEVLARHGSEADLYAETDHEVALAQALDHLSVKVHYVNEVTGKSASYISRLIGCDHLYHFKDLSPPVAEAARTAYPIPERLKGVLDELVAWDKLEEDRWTFVEYQHGMAVEARMAVLRHELDTRPAKDWSDFSARIEWSRTKFEGDHIPPRAWQEAIYDRIAKDLLVLRSASEAELAEVDMAHEALRAMKAMRS